MVGSAAWRLAPQKPSAGQLDCILRPAMEFSAVGGERFEGCSRPSGLAANYAGGTCEKDVLFAGAVAIDALRRGLRGEMERVPPAAAPTSAKRP